MSDFQLPSLENKNLQDLYALSHDRSKILTLLEKENDIHQSFSSSARSYMDLPFPLPMLSNIKIPFTLDFLSLEKVKRESKSFPWYYHFCEKSKFIVVNFRITYGTGLQY